MHALADEARDLLEPLPPSPAREALEELAAFAVARTL
jgi:geranylgeranyl pyrophosphate synthase